MELRYCEECGDMIRVDTDQPLSVSDHFLCENCQGKASGASAAPAAPSAGSSAPADLSDPHNLNLFSPGTIAIRKKQVQEQVSADPTRTSTHLKLLKPQSNAVPTGATTGSAAPAPTAQKILFRCLHCRSTLSIRPVDKTSRLTCPQCAGAIYVTPSGKMYKTPPSAGLRKGEGLLGEAPALGTAPHAADSASAPSARPDSARVIRGSAVARSKPSPAELPQPRTRDGSSRRIVPKGSVAVPSSSTQRTARIVGSARIPNGAAGAAGPPHASEAGPASSRRLSLEPSPTLPQAASASPSPSHRSSPSPSPTKSVRIPRPASERNLPSPTAPTAPTARPPSARLQLTPAPAARPPSARLQLTPAPTAPRPPSARLTSAGLTGMATASGSPLQDPAAGNSPKPPSAFEEHLANDDPEKTVFITEEPTTDLSDLATSCALTGSGNPGSILGASDSNPTEEASPNDAELLPDEGDLLDEDAAEDAGDASGLAFEAMLASPTRSNVPRSATKGSRNAPSVFQLCVLAASLAASLLLAALLWPPQASAIGTGSGAGVGEPAVLETLHAIMSRGLEALLSR